MGFSVAAYNAFYFDLSRVQATQMALLEKEEGAREEETAQKFRWGRCLLNRIN